LGEGAEAGLNAPIQAGGLNLSGGQRQLFCLARTLLRSSRVIVLDEATASVDMTTDALIQETIKASFSSSTVLTIAHRLETVMHCDSVLVMGAGKVVEKGAPDVLIANTQSVFYSMVTDARTLKH
jgi:ABC-type multidrug transport system fused ATPase/permease subunit